MWRVFCEIKMKKQLIIIFETEENNNKIMNWMETWAKESFKDSKTSIKQIKIEDIND